MEKAPPVWSTGRAAANAASAPLRETIRERRCDGTALRLRARPDASRWSPPQDRGEVCAV